VSESDSERVWSELRGSELVVNKKLAKLALEVELQYGASDTESDNWASTGCKTTSKLQLPQINPTAWTLTERENQTKIMKLKIVIVIRQVVLWGWNEASSCAARKMHALNLRGWQILVVAHHHSCLHSIKTLKLKVDTTRTCDHLRTFKIQLLWQRQYGL